MLADPGFVKVDDNKTPRTRAAGVASFKLGYKNSQAMDGAELYGPTLLGKAQGL